MRVKTRRLVIVEPDAAPNAAEDTARARPADCRAGVFRSESPS
jgi:hypothetical protein